MKWLASIAAALLVLAPAGAAPAPRAPAARDWATVATRSATGGFVLGNPGAKVKLIEFLSFTCPHCAVFEAEAIPRLTAKYVRSGRVSYEVRMALRDPFDLAAAVLARCQGPARFFALAPVVFAAQDKWMAKAQSWAENKPDLAKLSEAQAGTLLVRGAGLDALLAPHGLPAAQAPACMANAADQHLLAKQAQAIWAIPGFPGTPAFMIDGVLKPGIHDWAGLDAALAAAAR